MIYDVIIVGAGAAGLFAGINLPKDLNKLILEKNKEPGVKILLSGGERANVSNINIEVINDYFTQNKKALLSVFKKYNQWDIMNFFAENGINIIEEDRGRLILESGDSRELLDLLIKKVYKNKCEIKNNCDVKKIKAHPNPFLQGEGIEQLFEIELKNGKKYLAKNVIISSGGKSFSQVGTTGEGYNFARDFQIKIIEPTKALCGLSTKKNLSEISGISLNCKVELFDKNFSKKIIYSEFGPLLFTHFGISGPIIFNTGNALGEYFNKIKLTEKEFEKYILENIQIKIFFDNLEETPKRIIKFFNLENIEQNFIILQMQNFRSWKEAKATGGGVDLNELDKNFMVKKSLGLYFIGEVVDVVGKTGGFNLQWAWSSGYVCGKSFLE